MKSISPLSHIEISKKNLIHNIKQFRGLAKAGTQLSVAIKGNAYGHGQNEVAKILDPYLDYFQVNSLEELAMLRKVSKKPVLVLGYINKFNLIQAIKLNCVMAIFSKEQLVELEKAAQKAKVFQEIHLSIDAHLGREGVLVSELHAILQIIQKSKSIKLTGMYAHFANIEDTTNFTHAKKQIEEYASALKVAHSFGYNNLLTHMSATSGLLAYEKNTGINSLIRLGLGVYGMWPSEHLKSMYKNKINL